MPGQKLSNVDMLAQVQEFKENLVLALSLNDQEGIKRINVDVNRFLADHNYVILDILDDTLYQYVDEKGER